MKIFGTIVIISFLTLQNAFSQEVQKETTRSGERPFALALKYNTGNEVHNMVTDTFGNYGVVTASTSFSFLGLGATYTMPFSENWNFRGGFFLLGSSQKLFNFENGLTAQVTAHLGFRFAEHGIYFGPNIQQMIAVKPLTYTPQLGGAMGYQYFFNEDVAIDVGFELLAFKSKNTDAFIADQKTEMRTYNFTLSYFLN